MSTPIVVVGAGGFGREVLDVIEALNVASASQGDGSVPWNIVGVVDDSMSTENLDRLGQRSIRYLGSTSEYLSSADPGVEYAVVWLGVQALGRFQASAIVKVASPTKLESPA